MTVIVDWPRLLGDIAYLLGDPVHPGSDVRHPVGTPRLAKHLQRSRTTVCNWIDGAEPKHSDGEWLISVWEELSGKSAGFVPLSRRPLSASKT